MFPLAFDAGSGQLQRGGALDGRHPADDLPCHGEGRDVHGRGPDLRGARPRPDRRACRHRPGTSRDRDRLRGGRRGADGRAAERRLPREEAVARRGGGDRTVVVGSRPASGRVLHRGLRGDGARARAAPPTRAARASGPRVPGPGGDGARAGAVFAAARAAVARCRRSRHALAPRSPPASCGRCCCSSRGAACWQSPSARSRASRSAASRSR